MKKRIFSLLLSVCMVLSMLPMGVLAAEGISPVGASSVVDSGTPTVCKNHTAHDEGCGYRAATEAVPAVAGVSCTHQCEACKPAETLTCTCPAVDSGEPTHGEGCPLYVAPAAPEQSEAVQNVLALIAALPTVAELEAQDTESTGFPAYLEQLRTNVANARAAYDILTHEEKAVLDAAVLAKLTEIESFLAAMPVALMPAMPMAVASPHSHCVCGGSINVGDHTSHSAVTYTNMAVDFEGGELAAGNYVLTKDITLTSSVTIAAKATVNLCLNGFELNGNEGNYNVIKLYGGTLNLCDCSTGQAGKITGAKLEYAIHLYGGAVFNLYGGSITGNSGGGVNNSAGTFTMYGGSITGNTGQYAGGVVNLGTMKIGGNVTISGNTVNGAENNIVLAFFDSSPIRAVEIISELTNTTAMGVTISKMSGLSTTYVGGVFTSGTAVTNSDYASKFKSDVSGYVVEVEGNQLKLEVVPPITGTVSITGTLKFNQQLTAAVNGGSNTDTRSYQWKRGTTDIGTGTTYTTQEADVGETLTCVVTNSAESGSISSTTAIIAKADGPAAPAAPDINYTNETIATLDTWEYKVDNGAWTPCTAGMLATDFGQDGSAKEVQFRIKATATHETGAEVSLTIPARPTAPLASAFTVTKPTAAGGADGKLDGITSAMEYNTGSGAYTSGTGAELTDITDGTAYTIRTKATASASAFASDTVTVTVASKTSVTVTFADKIVNYNGAAQTHEAATTTATGGTMTYSYTTTDGILENGKPKGAGTYTVTAKYESATEIGTATATLTINKLPLTIKAADKTMYYSHTLPTLTVTYTGFITGEDESNALTGTAYTATTAADGQTVGTYAITINGNATAKNYTIETEKGKLTVLGDKQVIATDTMPTVPTDETVVIPAASLPDNTPLSNLQLSVSYTVTTEDNVKLDSETTGKAGFNKKLNLEISLINTVTKLPVQPKGDITIFIPYPAGTNKGDSFVMLHILAGGATQTITPTKLENGLQFTVSSLSPFAIGWTKYVAPGGGGSTGGGGGGGGGGSSSTAATTYTITATAGTGGTMSTGEKVQVREGDSAGFTITPNKGYQIADVLVNGKSIGAKNTYVFTNVRSNQTIHVTFKAIYTHVNPQTGVAFEDVQENDWFVDAVYAAVNNGWFSGTSKKTFGPHDNTTRGMIATVLYRMAGSPRVGVTSFGDVAAGTWYADAIAWAQANGIVAGYENGSYGPNDNITREQLAAILFRYAKDMGYDVSKTASLDNFTDGETVSAYAKEAMRWAVGSGIISGRGNNTLAPNATATRAEVATILVRFEELLTK